LHKNGLEKGIRQPWKNEFVWFGSERFPRMSGDDGLVGRVVDSEMVDCPVGPELGLVAV